MILCKNTASSEDVLLLLAPGVFLAHLFFFGWSEIVLDVEGLADLIGSLAFDHVGDGLARDVKQAANVQVVCSQNQFEQRSLINLKRLNPVR